MKNIVIINVFIISILFSHCSTPNKQEVSKQLKTSLRGDSQEFMKSLKSILVREIQTNGVASAVSVCSDTAQILTNSFGINKGIFIKRVSFKNRNKADYPDDIEAKALKYFEELKSKGELTDSAEYIEVVDEDNIKSVHYLKPILVQDACLNCHGSSEFIMPDVKAIINSKYPEDKATGYQVGDLRGAISIQKTL